MFVGFLLFLGLWITVVGPIALYRDHERQQQSMKWCADNKLGTTYLNRNGHFCVDKEGRIIVPFQGVRWTVL